MSDYKVSDRVNVRDELGNWRIGLLLEQGESYRGPCWRVLIGGQDPKWFYEDELGGDANSPPDRNATDLWLARRECAEAQADAVLDDRKHEGGSPCK